MLQKPVDYDQAQSYSGDYERLPAGGYVCEIKKMEEKIVEKTGSVMVSVSFEIAEGEYKDFFTRMYRRQKAMETKDGRKARWNGTYNVFPYTSEGLTNPRFKGLLTCIEKSNEGFRISWPLNLEMFRGMKLGLLFREEEYAAWDGSIRTCVSACVARSVDSIRNKDFTIPQKKMLKKQNETASDGLPVCGPKDTRTGTNGGSREFMPEMIDDEDLPF